MSNEIFTEVDGLIVGTYCGPERDDGMPRTRWQLTLTGIAEGRGYVTLDCIEAHALYRAIERSMTPRTKRLVTS